MNTRTVANEFPDWVEDFPEAENFSAVLAVEIETPVGQLIFNILDKANDLIEALDTCEESWGNIDGEVLSRLCYAVALQCAIIVNG